MKLTKPERRLLTQLLNGNWVYAYDHRDGGRGFQYASNLVKCTEAGRALIDKSVCVEDQHNRLTVKPSVIENVLTVLVAVMP